MDGTNCSIDSVCNFPIVPNVGWQKAVLMCFAQSDTSLLVNDIIPDRKYAASASMCSPVAVSSYVHGNTTSVEHVKTLCLRTCFVEFRASISYLLSIGQCILAVKIACRLCSVPVFPCCFESRHMRWHESCLDPKKNIIS